MSYDSEGFFDGSDDYEMRKRGMVPCEACQGSGIETPNLNIGPVCQECKGEGWGAKP